MVPVRSDNVLRRVSACRSPGAAIEQQQPIEQARRREYTWSDPAPGIAPMPGLAGIDVLRDMLDGALPAPPVMSTLAIEAEEFEVGRVVFSMLPQEFHLNPLGGVHGGVLATLLDSAIGCAVHSVLPQGVGRLTDATGRLLAHATSTCLLLTATG